MHYHLEIIMPPTDAPVKRVATIMKRFNREDRTNRSAFWVWYVIGGRWSADHLLTSIGEKRLAKFRQDVPQHLVGGIQIVGGLYEKPADANIDDLLQIWDRHFPEHEGLCPYWGLANQYVERGHPTDICQVRDLSSNQVADRVIIALEGAVYMIEKEYWNGVNFNETGWDGLVTSAIDDYHLRIKNYSQLRKGRATVQENWLAVTVDYHT